MMVLTTFALACCSKINSCQQPYSQEEIPELTAEGYNTCEAVIRNYTYRVCDGDLRNYPHWSHEGDSIRVCGYFYEGWDGDHLLPLFDYPDNLNGHDFLYIDLLGPLPDGFDISKKCYMEGALFFDPLYTSFGDYYIEPSICCDARCIRFE